MTERNPVNLDTIKEHLLNKEDLITRNEYLRRMCVELKKENKELKHTIHKYVREND